MTAPSATPAQIRRALLLREEIALLDVRQEAAFATGHPLFAANMAADRIELEAPIRLPRKNVPIVLYDAGEGLVAQAADRLGLLGYTDVRRLDGGLDAWRSAGYELFQDVNSYAKAVGELVEHRRHTPSLPADDVAALIESDADIAILDVRRPDEYATMNIPGSVSVPGAELVLRAGAVAPDPRTTIVVNCAGRTRSIIGTQSLINAGLPNKVVALRNGTMGYSLAGFKPDSGKTRRYGELSPGTLAWAQAAADRVGRKFGIMQINREALQSFRADVTRTLYVFDVRDPTDYTAGHLPGAINAPGGQLVQATDQYVGTLNARVVLVDDRAVRAIMTASWLKQMGWRDIFVLIAGGNERARPVAPVLGPAVPSELAVEARRLSELVADNHVT